MRKTALAALLLVGSGSLVAQEGTQWANVQAGYIKQTNQDQLFHDSGAFGLGLGLWINDHWGIEASGLYSRIESKATGRKDSETHAFLSGLYNFLPGKSFLPYGRFGLGVTSPSGELGAKDRPNYHVGLGVQAFFVENLMAFAEVRDVRVGTKSPARNELIGLVGLGYRWGGQPKVIAPPPPEPPPPEPPKPVEEVKPVPPPPPPPPAPEPPKPVEEVKPVPPPPPAKIVLDEAVLHFANGKADLSEDGILAVKKVADSLKDFKGSYTLVVSGHTSSVGGAALNKALGKRRADAVAKVLVDAGIPAASVQTIGTGPDKPIADNKTKEGQAKNRRVEIDVKVQGENVEVRKTETTVQETAAPAPAPKKKAKTK